MINKNKSCVIIGLGRMGERYIAIAKRLHLNIIGTFDQDIKKGLKITLKNKLNKKIFHSDINQALIQKPDIAIIASTSDSHLKLIKICSQYAIKKIMCEKPLSNSLINCTKIEKLLLSKKIKICINHSNRFSNQFIYLKKQLNSKKLGKIVSINYLCGNLGIAMNGTHFFDFFKFLTGSEIIKLKSKIKVDKNINPRGRKFKDYEGQISLWSKSGHRGYIDSSSSSHHGETLLCICKYGILFIDLFTGNVLINYRKSSSKKLSSNRYACPFISEKTKIKIDNIITTTKINLQKFLNNKNYVSLKDGILPVKVLIAALSSSEKKGREIIVNNFKNRKNYHWA